MKHGFFVCLLTAGVLALLPTQGSAKILANDFPTETRAEYVFACMNANKVDKMYMGRCSCAIDTIASRINYAAYEKAETMLRMQLSFTPNSEMFRQVGIYKESLDKLLRAQAAAEIKCF